MNKIISHIFKYKLIIENTEFKKVLPIQIKPFKVTKDLKKWNGEIYYSALVLKNVTIKGLFE